MYSAAHQKHILTLTKGMLKTKKSKKQSLPNTRECSCWLAARLPAQPGCQPSEPLRRRSGSNSLYAIVADYAAISRSSHHCHHHWEYCRCRRGGEQAVNGCHPCPLLYRHIKLCAYLWILRIMYYDKYIRTSICT